jgi:hypothetical protein
MCNTNPKPLFSAEVQARAEAGRPQVIFHRNGRWEVTFVEKGIFMVAFLDEDGVEHVEFLGDPSRLGSKKKES